MRVPPEVISANLNQFIGTQHYHRVLPTFLVTDGIKYLMDAGECYWLIHLYGLLLVNIDFNEQPFTVLKLSRIESRAEIYIEDGNGNVLESQLIDYTDFPLKTISLYAQWVSKHWIGMLPSEY